MGIFILLFLTVIISIYALLFYLVFSGHDSGDYDDSDLFNKSSGNKPNSTATTPKQSRSDPIIYDYEDYVQIGDGVICPDCDADDCDHVHDWL